MPNMTSKITRAAAALRPWIPLLLLFAALISSVCISFFKTEQYKDWKPTSGIVLENRQYISRLSGRSHRIYYSYHIDGKTYTGSNSYYGFSHEVAEGDVTDVWYNPDNPSESSFHQPGPLIEPYVPFFLVFPLVLFFSVRRKSIGAPPAY